jgi:hypothetical protein
VSVPRSVLKYQQECFREYGKDVGLPRKYTYPDGNPIRPLPPYYVSTRGLMIVGAYPSARFEFRLPRSARGHRRLVPVADNLHPFADEHYFDGLRPRDLESTEGLSKYLLGPLHIAQQDAWITDLVKVFLYKRDHADSCGAVHPRFHVHVLRSRFVELGLQSLSWLMKEVELCKPRLIVTLGVEVAQVVSGELHASADDLLNRALSRPDSLGGYPVLYLPHPDACRRWTKWRRNMARRCKKVSAIL